MDIEGTKGIVDSVLESNGYELWVFFGTLLLIGLVKLVLWLGKQWWGQTKMRRDKLVKKIKSAISQGEFKTYVALHIDQHKSLDRSMEKMSTSHQEVQKTVACLDGKVSEGFDMMRSLISKRNGK